MSHSLIASLPKAVAGLLCYCLLPLAALAEKPAALPAYQVDARQTSVSGLSSGAFMATQFHVAFSATLVGAGIVAGGPYYCAGAIPEEPFVVTATTLCMNPPQGSAPDAAALLAQARLFAQGGLIDDLANLKDDKILLFSGKADTTVATSVVDQAARFYRLAGVPADNIAYIKDINAGHAMITGVATDTACDLTAAPYINDCHFSLAQQILRQIYTDLMPPAITLSGSIIAFNQAEFIPAWMSSMSEVAYAYVPISCQTQTCRVHIAFHGCEQGATEIGDRFYKGTGYNELADANNIIVLYPQVQASYGFLSPYNPKGCWDFWGYSDINPFAVEYFTRQGTQMAAVKAMLDRLAQPRTAPRHFAAQVAQRNAAPLQARRRAARVD